MKLLRQLFIPTPYELVGYTTIAFVLLSISNLPSIFQFLIGSEERTSLQPIFNTYASNLAKAINEIKPLGTISTGLVWAVVGAIVYGIIWTGWNVYLEIHNDIEVGTHFLNPTEQAHHQFWYHKIGTVVFQIGIGLVFVSFTLLTFKYFYPLAVSCFRAVIADQARVSNWLYGLGGLLLFAAVLYTYVLLIRLLLRRVRVF